MWGASSVGRAQRSQRWGRGFKSPALHQRAPFRAEIPDSWHKAKRPFTKQRRKIFRSFLINFLNITKNMKLSKKSEYGLRALIELTKAYDRHALRRSEIAESQEIPMGFLETILLELKRAGILGSRPGAQGGYRLIKPPEDVSLGQVIRILDGPLAPIACVSQTAYQTCRDCPYSEAQECPIQSVMFEVRKAIVNVLDRHTLQAFYDRGPGRHSRKPPKPRKMNAIGRTE